MRFWIRLLRCGQESRRRPSSSLLLPAWPGFRIPDPVPGLIFRYGYLWLEEHQAGRVDPSKDRPACILLRVVSGAKLGRLRVEGTSTIAPDDVIILPITTQRPRRGAFAVELSGAEKRICRLDPEVASWLIVSEFNADSWPNADLALPQ